jgi:putative ABC transport system permease protein
MFKNHFTVAIRNFWRNKAFSLINILGLSIGISASLVIFLIVWYEFSYDRFEPGRDRICRVVLDAKFGGTPGHSAAVPAPLGGAIGKEVTGVEETVPVFQFQGDGAAKVSVTGDSAVKPELYKSQKEIIYVGPEYFHLIPYKWVAGSPEASLKDPFKVVLTESRARQYFPSVPSGGVMGREIRYNDEIRCTVSGVVKDLDENTSLTGSEFISYPTILNSDLRNQFMMTVWTDWMAYSQLYIKLSEGGNRQAVEGQINKLFKKYNRSPDDNSNTIRFRLQPLNEIHFDNNYAGFGQRIASTGTLYGLLAVAAFLLLLGCINFVNLSTAQASQRAKEIGIRKTMGSSKVQLVIQFLSETLLTTMLASAVAILLTPFLLKAFEDFIPRGVRLDLRTQPSVALFLVLLIVLVSFLAGIYPALVLSRFSPVQTLKNQVVKGAGHTRSAWLRSTLTVSQFVIAQFFIIGTILVGKQINYSLNKDMGFRKDAILTFETPRDTAATKGALLLNEINAIPGIEMTSSGFFSPADAGVAITNVKYEGKADLKANVQLRWGDTNYLKLYQVKILAGRNVRQIDSFSEFLINETYAKLLGFRAPEDALNKRLDFNGKKIPIVGVMKDFNAQSVHSPVDPVVFAGGRGSRIHILLRPKDPEGRSWQGAIAKIQQAYSRVYPGADFQYAFVDDTIARLYDTEQNISRLLLWATGLMILISCLGLLGIVIYITHTRTKEIGIRKILGASITDIVFILSGNLVKLVGIAFLIAAPVAWWASRKWLEGFAYRTSVSWWIFGLSAGIILLFALVTLSVQTIRAAIANPADSLRTE